MKGWLEVTDPDGNVTRIKATEVVAVTPNTIHETIRCNVFFGRNGQYGACSAAPAAEVWEALKSALAETPTKGRTFIIKDGDTLLQNPMRDQMLSEMRDIYDRTKEGDPEGDI